MKKILTMLALICVLPTAAALADDNHCFVPMADWQPREAVAQLIADNGWTVTRIKIDDGCYKIHGRDAAGRWIEVMLHPQTLAVIEFEYEHEQEDQDDEDDHDSRR
ncbi:MAG: PepSY domain-containing protein [Yoonia sp.]|uniref:PepSY domain-containing protein n=1 Tax=Yoonia sp. TaxID=2212373 RepID=UPI00273D81F5|nr:PepSY domain-containing protein [Yoonia sp.]MDP5085553.1 PepSY domain-containing protein [Yoonia sp.]MDP5361072.1 PepSY domain-containing protein [Paracoccaceae bacterium]